MQADVTNTSVRARKIVSQTEMVDRIKAAVDARESLNK